MNTLPSAPLALVALEPPRVQQPKAPEPIEKSDVQTNTASSDQKTPNQSKPQRATEDAAPASLPVAVEAAQVSLPPPGRAFEAQNAYRFASIVTMAEPDPTTTNRTA
jgi:hypothetical protein